MNDGDFRVPVALILIKNNIKKSPLYMAIDTPWPEVNEELEVECALLDSLIYKWSAQQAQAILGFMKGLNQSELGNNLGISQAALSYRLRDAGSKAIELCCKRFQNIIEQQIENTTSNIMP